MFYIVSNEVRKPTRRANASYNINKNCFAAFGLFRRKGTEIGNNGIRILLLSVNKLSNSLRKTRVLE